MVTREEKIQKLKQEIKELESENFYRYNFDKKIWETVTDPESVYHWGIQNLEKVTLPLLVLGEGDNKYEYFIARGYDDSSNYVSIVRRLK